MFQRVPLKHHTKYLNHTLNDTIFVNVNILELPDLRIRTRFLNAPRCIAIIYPS